MFSIPAFRHSGVPCFSTARCSGLRSSPEGSSQGGTQTRHERTAEIEPTLHLVCLSRRTFRKVSFRKVPFRFVLFRFVSQSTISPLRKLRPRGKATGSFLVTAEIIVFDFLRFDLSILKEPKCGRFMGSQLVSYTRQMDLAPIDYRFMGRTTLLIVMSHNFIITLA